MASASSYRKKGNKYHDLSVALYSKKNDLTNRILQIYNDVNDSYTFMYDHRDDFVGELNESYFASADIIFPSINLMISELQTGVLSLSDKSSEAEDIAQYYFRKADEAEADED